MKQDIKFKLLLPIGSFKAGKVLECFGGLVSGVNGIPFTNTKYFKIVKPRKSKRILNP